MIHQIWGMLCNKRDRIGHGVSFRFHDCLLWHMLPFWYKAKLFKSRFLFFPSYLYHANNNSNISYFLSNYKTGSNLPWGRFFLVSYVIWAQWKIRNPLKPIFCKVVWDYGCFIELFFFPLLWKPLQILEYFGLLCASTIWF